MRAVCECARKAMVSLLFVCWCPDLHAANAFIYRNEQSLEAVALQIERNEVGIAHTRVDFEPFENRRQLI